MAIKCNKIECKYIDKKREYGCSRQADHNTCKGYLTTVLDKAEEFIDKATILLRNVDKDYTPSEDWFDKRKELIGE